MDGFWDKVIKYVEPIFFMFVWVVTFSLIKVIVVPKKRTLQGFLVSMFVSVPTGVLFGMIAQELGAGDSVGTGIACLASIWSHDIILILAVKENRKVITKYIDRIITNLIDKWTK